MLAKGPDIRARAADSSVVQRFHLIPGLPKNSLFLPKASPSTPDPTTLRNDAHTCGSPPGARCASCDAYDDSHECGAPMTDSDTARTNRPILGGDIDLSDMAFLTVAEVAGVMRVSKMTVYRMVHSGELPAVRVGRSFRVPAKAVREYLSAAYVETS